MVSFSKTYPASRVVFPAWLLAFTKWFARIVSRVVERFLSGMAFSKQPHYATDNSQQGQMLKAMPRPLLAGYPKSKESYDSRVSMKSGLQYRMLGPGDTLMCIPSSLLYVNNYKITN